MVDQEMDCKPSNVLSSDPGLTATPGSSQSPVHQEAFWQLQLDVLFKHRRVPVSFRMETRAPRTNTPGGSQARFRTLWLSSEVDPSLYFFTGFDEHQPDTVKELVTKLALGNKGSAEVDIDEEGSARLLLSCGAASVLLYLTAAPPEKHKNFLLALLGKARAERDEEVFRRKNAEAHASALSLSLQQTERQCQRQEHELELLYKMLQCPAASVLSSMNSQKISEVPPSPMDTASSSQIATSIDMKTQTLGSIAEEQEEMEEEDVDEDDEEDSSRDNSTDKPTSSKTSTQLPADAQSQQKSLLLGIAQHILCALCPEGETLPDIQHMEQHFISKHVDEGSSCRGCPPSQTAIGDLRSHVKQHTARVYACELCGKRGRKHSIKAHLRTHTGEKPFVCMICNRAFADSSTFKRHQLVHTGEKKYVCPICGRGIARKDNVKIHLRSHRQLQAP